jgi:hypothetical protein
MEEDLETRALRRAQAEREDAERAQARDDPTEDGTDEHSARAMKAAYLKGKLDERAAAEREAEVEDDAEARDDAEADTDEQPAVERDE